MSSVEAEEAQTRIEELKDEFYTQQRTALLQHNDTEMDNLLMQKDEHIHEFEESWNKHEEQLVEESRKDIASLEEFQQNQLLHDIESFESKLSTIYKPSSQLL